MNPLPDLSSWHPVPPGAVIPREMRYARITHDGSIYVTTRVYDAAPARGVQCFTPTPLSPPPCEVTLGDLVERAEYLTLCLDDNPLAELVQDLLVFLSKSADWRS